jgi:hypothetical protein
MNSGAVCLGFVVREVVEGQASVTDHLSHAMAFVSGFVLEKTVFRNALWSPWAGTLVLANTVWGQ